LFYVIDTGSTGFRGRTWEFPVYPSPLLCPNKVLSLSDTGLPTYSVTASSGTLAKVTVTGTVHGVTGTFPVTVCFYVIGHWFNRVPGPVTNLGIACLPFTLTQTLADLPLTLLAASGRSGLSAETRPKGRPPGTGPHVSVRHNRGSDAIHYVTAVDASVRSGCRPY
jgi:hypothetical protein